jgi:hypothetical protein
MHRSSSNWQRSGSKLPTVAKPLPICNTGLDPPVQKGAYVPILAQRDVLPMHECKGLFLPPQVGFPVSQNVAHKSRTWVSDTSSAGLNSPEPRGTQAILTDEAKTEKRLEQKVHRCPNHKKGLASIPMPKGWSFTLEVIKTSCLCSITIIFILRYKPHLPL